MERADRQLVGSVGPDREGAVLGIEPEVQVSRHKLRAVVVTEDRHEKLVVEVAAIRVPIDVEPPRIFGVRTPFEDIEPERIIGPADPHVVRHEIEDLLETDLAERLVQPRERRRTPQGRVQQVVVRDIVTVRAARSRLQIRRGVKMADTELRQVGHA